METLTLPRLLGRAWGGASMLLGLLGSLVILLFVGAFVFGAVRGVVSAFHATPHPLARHAVHAARPEALVPPRPVPPVGPQYFAPLPPPPGYADVPVSPSAAAMQAYLARQNFYAPPPMPPPMMGPPPFVFVRPAFGHPVVGFMHFGHGGHR